MLLSVARESPCWAVCARGNLTRVPLECGRSTRSWGHAGEFDALTEFIFHYSESDVKLRAYTNADIPDPLLQGMLFNNTEDVIALRDPIILPVVFPLEFAQSLTAFMTALTDKRAQHLQNTVPGSVPSGLPVDHK